LKKFYNCEEKVLLENVEWKWDK